MKKEKDNCTCGPRTNSTNRDSDNSILMQPGSCFTRKVTEYHHGGILKEAHCSKGRFYYYFHAKAELLDSMYELFDEKYEEFYQSIDKTLGSFEAAACLKPVHVRV